MKRIELECGPEGLSVRRARAFVKATLVGCDMHDLVDVAELLTSELVTNALVHARSGFRVTVEVDPPVAKVEVTDTTPALLPSSGDGPRLDAEHGRGLFLVKSLAQQWGYRSIGESKTVWFELRGGASVG